MITKKKKSEKFNRPPSSSLEPTRKAKGSLSSAEKEGFHLRESSFSASRPFRVRFLLLGFAFLECSKVSGELAAMAKASELAASVDAANRRLAALAFA